MSTCHLTSVELLQHPPSSQTQDRNFAIQPFAYVGADDRSKWAILGESMAIRQLRGQVRHVAPYFRVALIRGEEGAGKQIVARAIHARSDSAECPFIVADACALAESVSHSAEPQSQASPGTVDVLESVRGGTLYLEQIGALSFRQQAALLQFLRSSEEQWAVRSNTSRVAGESRQPGTQYPCMRILASSNRDLRTLSTIGQFRQDLYARLSAVEILVPPLRQRVEDIPSLVDWLLRRIAELSGQSLKSFAEPAMCRLQAHPWPGNLRELDQVVTQSAALAEGKWIEPRHLTALVLPDSAKPSASPAVTMERLDDVIQRHVLDVLTRCGGNKVRTADLLGISRSTLYRMLGAATASERLLAE